MSCRVGCSSGSRTAGSKPTWATELWKDIAAQVHNVVVEVHHVGAHPRLKRRDAAGVQGSMAACGTGWIFLTFLDFMQDLPCL